MSGSYSAVRRILADIRSAEPPETTCRLDFYPGEAVQVDFSAGPSHLDIANEQRVTQALAQMSLTRIIVAHRPETIATAQRVVALQQGKVLRLEQSAGCP